MFIFYFLMFILTRMEIFLYFFAFCVMPCPVCVSVALWVYWMFDTFLAGISRIRSDNWITSVLIVCGVICSPYNAPYMLCNWVCTTIESMFVSYSSLNYVSIEKECVCDLRCMLVLCQFILDIYDYVIF